MAFISVTYSFTNATAADAGQVNTNFTDLINGTSDGTSDLNIAALTCAGTVTLNGDIVLSSGLLASSIPIKTTRTYDIGSANLGLRSIYFGMNSTHTAAISAPSSGASGDYSLILPALAPAIYDVISTTDGSGATVFRKDSALSINASGGTSGVTLTTASPSVSVFTPSAAITIKLDNSFTAGRQITIVNNGTAEISLTANDDTVIATVYRQTTYTCMTPSATPTTNTSWLGLTPIISPWYTAASATGSWTTNVTHSAKRRRVGSQLHVEHLMSVTGAIGTPGLCLFTVPDSLTIETGDLAITTANRDTLDSWVTLDGNGSRLFNGCLAYATSTTLQVYSIDDTTGAIDRGALAHATNNPFSFANNDKIIARYSVPIVGWSVNKG